MIRQVAKRIHDTSKILRTLGYLSETISDIEFINYLTGETLTGDTTTPEEILANDYLMIHELVEISELKRQSIPIDKHTIQRYSHHTYTAHLTATDWEFSYALKKGDAGWLQQRLTIAQHWLEDPYLPPTLTRQYRTLLEEYSRHLKTFTHQRTEQNP
jgi:hypothetical protein